MSAHPVELHSTKHVLELANGAPLSGGADTFDLDILCATAPAGPGGASDPSNDIQTALGPDAPEPNKFCVMHPDPTCATRFKLCDECTRYMYSDAALLQRRQLTACLATTDRSRAIESNPSAHNPHRLDKFHLPRGYYCLFSAVEDGDIPEGTLYE